MQRQGMLVIAAVLLGMLLFLAQEGLAQKVTQYWWEREGKEQPFPYPGSPEVEEFFRTHANAVRPGDYREAARAAACIVLGTVKEIKSNPKGPYHTWVTISVERYLKGGSGEKEVLVKLISGKTEEGEVRLTIDPKFQEGENVLLFLQTIPLALHDGAVVGHAPDYRNVTECKGYFEIVGGEFKYIIEESMVIGTMTRKQGRKMLPRHGRMGLDQFIQEILSALDVKGGQDEERKAR